MEDSIINPVLIEMLCCPACDDRPKIELKENKLVCSRCGRAYPIQNEIPVMLVEESEDWEKRQ